MVPAAMTHFARSHATYLYAHIAGDSDHLSTLCTSISGAFNQGQSVTEAASQLPHDAFPSSDVSNEFLRRQLSLRSIEGANPNVLLAHSFLKGLVIMLLRQQQQAEPVFEDKVQKHTVCWNDSAYSKLHLISRWAGDTELHKTWEIKVDNLREEVEKFFETLDESCLSQPLKNNPEIFRAASRYIIQRFQQFSDAQVKNAISLFEEKTPISEFAALSGLHPHKFPALHKFGTTGTPPETDVEKGRLFWEYCHFQNENIQMMSLAKHTFLNIASLCATMRSFEFTGANFKPSESHCTTSIRFYNNIACNRFNQYFSGNSIGFSEFRFGIDFSREVSIGIFHHFIANDKCALINFTDCRFNIADNYDTSIPYGMFEAIAANPKATELIFKNCQFDAKALFLI